MDNKNAPTKAQLQDAVNRVSDAITGRTPWERPQVTRGSGYDARWEDPLWARNEQRRRAVARKVTQRMSRARRRARCLGREAELMPKGYVVALRCAQGDRCCGCGLELVEQTAEVDHVQPLKLGGHHRWDNIAWLCRACNRRKAVCEPEEFFTPCQLKALRSQQLIALSRTDHVRAQEHATLAEREADGGHDR